MNRPLAAAGIVLVKELRDALRDRATLMTILVGSILSGPLVILIMSMVFKDVEQAVEARTMSVAGIEQAPTLHKHLLRRGVVVSPLELPGENSRELDEAVRRILGEPDTALSHVVIVPPKFEEDLLLRRQPELIVYYRDDKRKSSAVVGTVRSDLEAFARERAMLDLAWMAVPPATLEPLRIESRALSSGNSLTRPLALIMPLLIVLAAAAASLSAALDSTAGERERGSLEPLLMNPASPWSLAMGKWAAVAALGLAAALLTCLGFMPMPWLVGSERLGDLLAFTPAQAALSMLAAAPIAAAIPALIMALAIHCKTVKQAQSTASFVILGLSMAQLPLQLSGSALTWQLWVPGAAQMAQIGRIFSDQPISLREWLIPAAVATALTVACLVVLARGLRLQAVR